MGKLQKILIWHDPGQKCWYCWWKRSQKTTWDLQNPANRGINYQPQLVSRISEPSTVMTRALFCFRVLLFFFVFGLQKWLQDAHAMSCDATSATCFVLDGRGTHPKWHLWTHPEWLGSEGLQVCENTMENEVPFISLTMTGQCKPFFSAMCGPNQNQQAHIPPRCSNNTETCVTILWQHNTTIETAGSKGYLAVWSQAMVAMGQPSLLLPICWRLWMWIRSALCKFNQEFNNQRFQVYVDLLTPFFFSKHSLMILTWHRFWLVSSVSYMFFMFISGESSMGFVELWWQEVSKLEKSPDLPSDQLGRPNDFWIDRRFPVLYLSQKKGQPFRICCLIFISISQGVILLENWRTSSLRCLWHTILRVAWLTASTKTLTETGKFHGELLFGGWFFVHRGSWRKPFPRWINAYVPTFRYMLRRPDR